MKFLDNQLLFNYIINYTKKFKLILNQFFLTWGLVIIAALMDVGILVIKLRLNLLGPIKFDGIYNVITYCLKIIVTSYLHCSYYNFYFASNICFCIIQNEFINRVSSNYRF